MKKKKKMRSGTIMMLVGIVMLGIATFFVVFNSIKEKNAGQASEEALSKLTDLITHQETVPANETGKSDDRIDLGLSETAPQARPVDDPSETKAPERSSAAVKETEKETAPPDPNNMPYSIIDGNYYIGVLDMPTLGITLPVLWGWSDALMDVAPCRFSGNTTEGNIIILAHNYSTHFGRLFELGAGDSISFTSVDGELITYVVTQAEQFHRSEIHRIYEGDWDLTLFTCVPNTYNRIAVRCVRTN